MVGGSTPEGPGCCYPPSVLADADPGSRLMDTEILGPVAAILTFDDEDEVVHQANDTPWGLVGHVFTEGLDRALRVGERLDRHGQPQHRSCARPGGSVRRRKQSGLGREGGLVVIQEFLGYQYSAVPVR